jgi:integrase
VESYYVKAGKPTSEQDTIRQALRFVRKLYGASPAHDFSPLALKAVRQAMIDHGLCRGYINKQVSRVKRMFAWAVENELVPVSIHQALSRVAGLRKDRSTAREKKPIKPVAEAHVQAVLPRVPPMTRTMIQVQRLCGGRPQDVVELKPCDIDRSGPIWEYRPGRHKTEHHERERIVFFGLRAQELLKPWLENLRPEEYVFSPIRSERNRLMAIRQGRGLTAVMPERDRGKWALREHYDTASYRRAIRRACKKVGIPIWCPLQLRHTAGTLIRKKYGLEASQAVLGHAELSVTQVYSEVNLETARSVMGEIG